MLENYNNREYVNTNNEHITIEHIFPRNPNENWNTDLTSEELFYFQRKVFEHHCQFNTIRQ
jgi:hypothetical protein